MGALGLATSIFATLITGLSFWHTLAVKKESGLEKLAKATDVSEQLILIKKDIRDVEDKLEDQGKSISLLQRQGDVLDNQMVSQLKAVEKLDNKLSQWRNDE